MGERLIHPGICVEPDLAIQFSPVEERKIPQYLKFSRLDGLNDGEKVGFDSAIRTLFSETKEHWEPRRCVYYRDSVIVGMTDMKIPTKFGKSQLVIEQDLDGNHFWTELRFKGGRRLIIDPTGLDPTGEVVRPMYVPYFGPVELAPDYHRKYYENILRPEQSRSTLELLVDKLR